MKQLLINARVVTPQRIYTGGCVAIEETKIAAIYPGSDGIDLSGWSVVDAGNRYLAPGFVDIHVHGGGGSEFNLASSEVVRTICAAHARFGTTSILPTTLAAPLPDLYATIDAVRAAQAMTPECNILGIHLEGPYFAQSQRGAQNPEHIILPMPEEYEPLLDHWDQIRMVGAAPELPGALALGDALRTRGITASIAHSDATFDRSA